MFFLLAIRYHDSPPCLLSVLRKDCTRKMIPVKKKRCVHQTQMCSIDVYKRFFTNTLCGIHVADIELKSISCIIYW